MIRQQVLFMLLIVLGSPLFANACGCMPGCLEYVSNEKKCVQDRVKGSEAVFRGKVISVDLQNDAGSLYKARFEVIESWKGISSNLVDVFYYDLAANGCPFSLNRGDTYTFFAWISDGKLSIDECGSGSGYERYFPKGKRWTKVSK